MNSEQGAMNNEHEQDKRDKVKEKRVRSDALFTRSAEPHAFYIFLFSFFIFLIVHF